MGWSLAGSYTDWKRWRIAAVYFVITQNSADHTSNDSMNVFDVLEGSTFDITPVTAGNRNDTGQPVVVAYQMEGRIDLYLNNMPSYETNYKDLATEDLEGIIIRLDDLNNPTDELYITFENNGNNTITASGFSARNNLSSSNGNDITWSIDFEGIVSADAITNASNTVFPSSLT